MSAYRTRDDHKHSAFAGVAIDDCGDVLQRGHFVGKSGRHLDAYFDKNKLFAHPETLAGLCRILWFPFEEMTLRRAIVGPETGGARLAELCNCDMLSWRAERAARMAMPSVNVDSIAVGIAKGPHGSFVLSDEQVAQLQGRSIVVVEDVLTTGGSVREVVSLLRAAQLDVLRVSAIVNRGKVTPDMIGADLKSLVHLDLPSWSPDECLMNGPCSRGEPIRTDLGHAAPKA